MKQIDNLTANVEILRKILTIDGRGRPAKAKTLLHLIQTISIDDLKLSLEKIASSTW